MTPAVWTRRGAIAAALICGVGTAEAHPLDTYPAQYEVVPRAGQVPAQDLVVATTYGMILSHDRGATWRWVCEAAFGVTDSWEPEYEYTAAGVITATTGGGLFRTTDGCTWTPAGGRAGSDVASTTAVGGDGTLWLGSGTNPAVVLRSSDDGATFQPTGPLGANVVWIESLAVAPSNPQRVYATGSTFSGTRQVRLWRSDDGGTSWTSLPTAGFAATNISELQIAAIADGDPDRVYLRVTNAAAVLQEAVFVSVDAGAAWSEVLRVNDYLPGVVVRDGGAALAISRASGLYRSPDGVTAMAVVSGATGVTASCLTELEDELWVCADNFGLDRMGLGRSDDALTWTRVMTLLELLGPIACPAGTIQRDQCERGTWCFYVDLYDLPSDEVACTGADAGTDGPVVGPDPGPCCGAHNGGGAGSLVAAAAVAAVLLRRRSLSSAGSSRDRRRRR